MALVKFYNGNTENLDNLPIKEGQIIFSVSNSNGSIYYDSSNSSRIKMTALADKAIADNLGNNIGNTYISNLTGTTSKTNYVITPKTASGNNKTAITIPAASSTIAGLMTTETQSFSGNKTFNQTVTFLGSADASLGSYTYPAVTIGPYSSAHIEMDANEIMAKGSANSAANLYLNNEGGVVDIGPGGMNVRGHIIAGATTKTLDIGSTNNYFRNIYGTNFYGNASSATLLKPHNSNITYQSSSWNSTGSFVWGMSFKDSSLGIDPGDITLSLVKYSDSQNTLNLCIDGQINAGSVRPDRIGFIGNLQGNASTATKLQTARTINGTAFDGSKNITTTNWGTARNITIADYNSSHTGTAISVNGSSNITLKLPSTITATLSGTALNAQWLTPNNNLTLGASGLQYFNLEGDEGTSPTVNNTPTSAWYHILRMNHGNSKGYYADIAVPLNDTAGIYWRQIRYGINYGWFKLLDSNNYTNYTVTKTGSGASGTWGINITGNAGTATKLQTARTIRTNLGSTSTASFDGTANITPGITGILAVSHGGTGASSASTARTNLGAAAAKHTHSFMDDITGTVPVSRGGTGAWDAGAACTNLGAVTISTSQSITGAKTFKSTTTIQNNATAPTLSFQSNNGALTTRTATIYNNLVSTTATQNFLYFRLYRRETGGAVTSYYEEYRLPTATSNRTSNRSYEILTSKVPVTVRQGGTGTDTRGAQSGGALANIGCIYSSSEPSSPYTGMVWLKPVT